MKFDGLILTVVMLLSGSTQCVGGVIGEDVGENMAIIGDEWIKNWYTVFDYGNLVSSSK